ncbi:SLC13 family permease [Thermodesulfatator indicus]
MALILIALSKFPLTEIPTLVDWKTILSLSGLILITTAIKESGAFYYFSYFIASNIRNERILSLFFVVFTAFIATFLTNDISLFIVVPITLTLQDILQKKLAKLVIFEIIAANVGSTLTPIGNPQNLFLWHQWEISFLTFIEIMFPLFLLLLILLVLFVFFLIPSEKISKMSKVKISFFKKDFVVAMFFFVLFLCFLEFDQINFLIFLILIFALFFRKILFKCDWGLIFLFILIFINIKLIFYLKFLNIFFNNLLIKSSKYVFITSALASQIFSNVPAAIFLVNYSTNLKAIAYGVNVAGNGLVFASLANLIGLRLYSKRDIYLLFHLYSIPYFLISFILSLIIFFH